MGFDGTAETTLGFVDERCASGGMDVAFVFSEWYVDNTHGWIRFGNTSSSSVGSYQAVTELWEISGFPSLLEVFQTYAPTSSSISFRVPYMPEGMGGADRFDTYWGDLATVGDWSQAQGLQCGYPAAPPIVGDYLTVTDTLPAPAPDTGYYYVTAATYQGQTRYGRKTSGGRLTGRDPAVLPTCMSQASTP